MSDSWLFATDEASVRIVRTDTLTCAICGPGREEKALSFQDGAQLAAFLRETEEHLTEAGYRFKGFQADRRQRSDRRTSARGTDRRTSRRSGRPES